MTKLRLDLGPETNIRCRRHHRRRLHVLTFTYQEGLTLTDVAAAAGKVEGVPFQTIEVER